jgi:aspartokinase-like uncharacterized kinase
MPRRPIRVVKVGGSLFDLPDLRARLTSWLSEQSPAASVLIAGGGALADAIGEWDRIHKLGDAIAHWLCLDALRITASFLHAVLQWEQMYASPHDLKADLTGEQIDRCVFDPSSFATLVSKAGMQGTTLPCDWTVTSDSVAASVAQWLDAQELVLLKSALPQSNSIGDASRAGYVDEFFATLGPKLRRIRCVNLRDDAFGQCDLR